MNYILLLLLVIPLPLPCLPLTVKLYLVRHCTSTFNAMSIPAGFKNDPDLSDQGREQAEMVGKELGRLLEERGGGTTVLTSGETSICGKFDS